MKKEKIKSYENYPCWGILISNLLEVIIYFIGAFILYQLGLIWMFFYLIYILILQIMVLKKSCVNCYYYGKYCAFGKGKLASLFFKKGSKNFCQRKVTWKDIIPDFLVSIIPIIVGIVILIINFSWLILGLIMLLILFSFTGTGLVRGKIACKYCKQREIGCPASELFNKNKEKNN